MLYILEGCDGSGKTTLAKFLSKILDAEIVHCNQHTPNDLLFFNNIINEARSKNIIADRFCYGQFVYQEEKDRPLKTLNNLYTLETAMLHAGVKVILVTATNEIIRQRLSERNETLINGLTIAEVKIRFDEIRKKSLLTWSEYSTGGDLNV